ncbi:MAG: hypothetical protein [Caudoviricetes sp.]|nr:MAG: hypothetical protein [Caudoviricetes sp.]
MSIDVQKKPDYLIFAEGAKQEELTEFPDINRGWGATIELTASKPPMEWFNGAFNRVDRHLLYLLQQGVPEWSDKITYPVNAVIKYNGILYIATNENNNAKPSTNTTKWKNFFDEASLTKKGIVQLNSAVNSISESDAATPLAVKKTNDLATSANNAATTAKNIANTANDKANAAYDTAIKAFPKTGGKIEGSVDATGGFYQKGNKLIMQGEYGIGHQNLSVTKVSDNLNEQNASFFGSLYTNIPESIKPYIKNGSGVVGITLPYRTTSDGGKFSSRFFTEVGVTPSKIYYQECNNGTWQKPVQLITEQNIKSHTGTAHIVETYKSEDGSSWYRKWSDGFVEQGGVKHGTFNAQTVHNLVIPFSSNEYVILVNTLAIDDTVSTTSAARDKQLSTFKCEASRAQGYNYTYTTITFLAYGYQ